MRNRGRKRGILSDINITPFTDVVLVLLVVFMLATPLLYRGALDVKPPETTNARPADKTEPMTIQVDANGAVLYSGRTFSLPGDEASIKALLSAALAAHPDATVVINGDRTVAYDAVMKVIDLVNGIGVKKILLGTLLKNK